MEQPRESDLDGENSIGQFVKETSAALRALHQALNLVGEGNPLAEQLRPWLAIVQRIKEAARLRGFRGIVCLCERLETLCDIEADDEKRVHVIGAVRKLVCGVEALVRSISKDDEEDQNLVEEYAAFSSALLSNNPRSPVDESVIDTPMPSESSRVCSMTAYSRDPRASTPRSYTAESSAADRYFLPRLDRETMAYFASEADNHLQILEDGLARLRQCPADRTLVDGLFRTAHTLKGAAYTVGFRVIGDLIHCLEDFMEQVRA
ncbi:MAG: Hpt domain-containing protein, partial [Nitrospira sp.]|nr:Hpt domain-containing protein [Nitrospira sp.]